MEYIFFSLPILWCSVNINEMSILEKRSDLNKASHTISATDKLCICIVQNLNKISSIE